MTLRDYDHVLYSGPWVQMKGERPTRIVLHAEFEDETPVKYIVHTQVQDEEGRTHYHNGNYYECRFPEAREKSFKRFVERCESHYHQGRSYVFPEV
jgi:hypothetical protein